MADEVRFAQMANGRDVAYRVLTDGPGPVIVHHTEGPWPLDLLQDDPMYDRFLRTLGTAGRLVLFDRPGIGSSDPFDRDHDMLDQAADAFIAVVEAVGARAAWSVGNQVPVAIRAIQKHRDAVLGTVLINPLSTERFEVVTDEGITRSRGPRLFVHPSRAGDPVFEAWLERATRLGQSTTDRADFLAAQYEAILRFRAETEPLIDAPPTRFIRRRDALDQDTVEFWQRLLPDAEFVTIEGADSGVAATDAGLVAELGAEFITGTPVATAIDRRLVAVLFTDLVDSTPQVAERGDVVWRSTLDQYEASVERVIERHHGTVIKATGDGVLATFPSGSEAVAAAVAIGNATADLGLEGRAGIHVGEVEQRDGDIGGIAVHLAARVMGEAEPDEVVVTSSVVDTSSGGAHRFRDRGAHTLKGIDRPWHLFAVESGRS